MAGKRFDGKVAIVTGGSMGIGRATALQLADEGAHVVACARRQPRLDELAQEIAAISPRIALVDFGTNDMQLGVTYGAALVTFHAALQQLLDELAARVKGGAVRVSPLVYLLGLIKRAHAGRFEPEAGWTIADARERRRRHEALGRAPPCAGETLETKAAPDNALVRRLEAIRARARWSIAASHSILGEFAARIVVFETATRSVASKRTDDRIKSRVAPPRSSVDRERRASTFQTR